MKKGLLGLFILLSLLAVPGVQALGTPEITFIPENISADTGFIAVADPQSNESVRITWTLPGFPQYGLFPRTDDKFMCYFSNTDYKSNCGPSPFKLVTQGQTPYTFYILAEDPEGNIVNNTLDVNTGGIEFGITKDIQGNRLFLIVSAKGALPDEVEFSVYDMELNEIVSEKPLEYDIQTDRFKANTTLPDGEYYLAVWGNSVSPVDFGGTVERVVIGLPSEVPGAEGVVRADSVKMDVVMEAGKSYPKTGFSLVNMGGTTLSNLTVDVPDELSPYLDISLDSDILEQNASTFFTVTISNVDSALDTITHATVYSGTNRVGIIPLDITVSVVGVAPGAPAAAPGTFTISPNTWTGEYLVGPIPLDFTIENTGDDALTGLSYSASGGITGLVDVTLPESVLAGDTASGTATITPYSPGTYTGTIQIDSDSGSQAIMVSMNVYEDITSNIDTVRAELDDTIAQMSSAQMALLSDVTDELSADLDSAQSDFDFGSYSSAQDTYQEVSAKVDLLSSFVETGATPTTPTTPTPTPTPTPSEGNGGGLIIIILVVVLVALVGVAVWYYFTHIKKGGVAEEEKKLEEEF